MNDGMGIVHALMGAGGLMVLLWLVFVVFLFLLPFFVLKIRNEVVAMNRKMDAIICLLGEEKAARSPAGDGKKVRAPVPGEDERWERRKEGA